MSASKPSESRVAASPHVNTGNRVGLVNQNVVDSAMSCHPRTQPTAPCSWRWRAVRVFFDQLRKHPVPVEEGAIRAISNNSVALDLYAWLAYRLHALPKSTPVSWAALKGQFGAGCARMDNFKPTFSPT